MKTYKQLHEESESLYLEAQQKQEEAESLCCPHGHGEMQYRMHEVNGTHDLVEMLTCLECGYKSPIV